MKGFSAFREHTVVDLTDVELFALVGATGSGKSTVIDAITFALFGSIARYDDNRAVAPVVNQTSNEARVALRFELNDHEYTAVRVVRRTAKGATTKEARLERGADVLAADARTMNKVVENLLGLNVDQFNRTVVLPQGRFADFLQDDAANRQATLRQLLGLDVYARLGQAARQLSKRCQDQMDVLRGDLESSSQILTESHREELTARLPAIASARALFESAISTLNAASERRSAAVNTASECERHLDLIRVVRAPDGVDELDASIISAEAAEREELNKLTDAKANRQTARQAVDAGPDRAAVLALLQRHADLVEATDALTKCDQHIAELTIELDAARELANEVRSVQEALDLAAERTRSAADDARARSASVPSVLQLDVMLQLHATYGEQVRRRERLAVAATEAAGRVAAARQIKATSEEAAEELDELVASLRDRVGIAAHASSLVIGEACPLCLQNVQHLPEHHVDDQLKDAQERLRSARSLLKRYRDELDLSTDDANKVEAQLGSAERDLALSIQALDGVPAPDVLKAQRESSEKLSAEADLASTAARQAAAAAKASREDPEHRRILAHETAVSNDLVGVRGERTGTERRVAALQAELSSSPSGDECARLAEKAGALADALAAAEELELSCERSHQEAARALTQSRGELTRARHELSLTRDSVGSLGAPNLDEASIANAWSELLAWAGEREAELSDRRERALTDVARIDQEGASIVDNALSQIAVVLGEEPPTTDFRRLGEFLAARDSSAQAAIDAFDRDSAKHAALQQRVNELAEQEAVAKKLGHLLRSDGFEGWLMQSALDQLATRATERLFELSGGQYSLVLQDRAFAVRDHNNAGDIRGARTLSGGETFLVSLSLALALASSTAELAPEGAPQLESIFLDEGFDTLDSNALDTVASAIEELGASGRMVGIVTHIRELADRMPVRLEVTKSGGSSRVERVEA